MPPISYYRLLLRWARLRRSCPRLCGALDKRTGMERRDLLSEVSTRSISEIRPQNRRAHGEELRNPTPNPLLITKFPPLQCYWWSPLKKVLLRSIIGRRRPRSAGVFGLKASFQAFALSRSGCHSFLDCLHRQLTAELRFVP